MAGVAVLPMCQVWVLKSYPSGTMFPSILERLTFLVSFSIISHISVCELCPQFLCGLGKIGGEPFVERVLFQKLCFPVFYIVISVCNSKTNWRL